MTYRVRWEIDVDADSPRHAALQAIYIQCEGDVDRMKRRMSDPDAAVVFDVSAIPAACPCGKPHPSPRYGWERIDLADPDV